MLEHQISVQVIVPDVSFLRNRVIN